MKNRTTIRHGMLADLADYLQKSGWKLESPVGEFEVLRARRPGYRMRLQHRRERQQGLRRMEKKQGPSGN